MQKYGAKTKNEALMDKHFYCNTFSTTASDASVHSIKQLIILGNVFIYKINCFSKLFVFTIFTRNCN